MLAALFILIFMSGGFLWQKKRKKRFIERFKNDGNELFYMTNDFAAYLTEDRVYFADVDRGGKGVDIKKSDVISIKVADRTLSQRHGRELAVVIAHPPQKSRRRHETWFSFFGEANYEGGVRFVEALRADPDLTSAHWGTLSDGDFPE